VLPTPHRPVQRDANFLVHTHGPPWRHKSPLRCMKQSLFPFPSHKWAHTHTKLRRLHINLIMYYKNLMDWLTCLILTFLHKTLPQQHEDMAINYMLITVAMRGSIFLLNAVWALGIVCFVLLILVLWTVLKRIIHIDDFSKFLRTIFDT